MKWLFSRSVYLLVFLDCMYIKNHENGRVITKIISNILNINQTAYKYILGFHIAESEATNFWLGVLTDLKWMVLVACVDRLTSFLETIKVVFAQTEIYLCIVHQIRNSLNRLINTTNATEEFYRQIRKFTKTKEHFTCEKLF